jgi:uncharacterized protein YecA (UPF0149 family)
MTELAEIPEAPEVSAEDLNINQNEYVPGPAIVEKMKGLVEQKKEELLERERLTSMPKQPYRREDPRVGRNDPCPCGSGKKFKKCHMGNESELDFGKA